MGKWVMVGTACHLIIDFHYFVGEVTLYFVAIEIVAVVVVTPTPTGHQIATRCQIVSCLLGVRFLIWADVFTATLLACSYIIVLFIPLTSKSLPLFMVRIIIAGVHFFVHMVVVTLKLINLILEIILNCNLQSIVIIYTKTR
jgi:hypothetical protein